MADMCDRVWTAGLRRARERRSGKLDWNPKPEAKLCEITEKMQRAAILGRREDLLRQYRLPPMMRNLKIIALGDDVLKIS